jgi:mannosyl-3-phosphoglycerate phosphatase
VRDPACPLPRDSTLIRAALFTDLDGTLLDPDTYLPSREAIATIEKLAHRGVVTIPVTSKTWSEVRRLESIVRFAELRVVEGGAVIVDRRDDEEVVGVTRSQLIDVLQTLKREGWRVRGLSDMTAAEIAGLTGLDLAAASLANDRRASEPFVLSEDQVNEAEELARRASDLGASMTRGGRLWHLLGSGIDKGFGVREALKRSQALRSVTVAAVGDAWNDLPMFHCVHLGYLLGEALEEVDLPNHVERIPSLGPAGFVQAARDFEDRLGLDAASG